MNFLNNILKKSNVFKNICDTINNKKFPFCVSGVSSVHVLHLAHLVCNESKKIVIITYSEENARRIVNDFLIMGNKALLFPFKDFEFRNLLSQSYDIEKERLSVLHSAICEKFDVIVACVDAALQHTIPKNIFEENSKILKTGEEISPDEIKKFLLFLGYCVCEQVETKGQFSFKGGILDVFPTGYNEPIRIEFFADKIHSIAFFDIKTKYRQKLIEKIKIFSNKEILLRNKNDLIRKIENIISLKDEKTHKNCIELLKEELSRLKSGNTLGSLDKFLPLVYKNPATLFSYFDSSIIFFICEPSKIKKYFLAEDFKNKQDLEQYLEEGVLTKELFKFSEDFEYFLKYLADKKTVYLENFKTKGFGDMPLIPTINVFAKEIPPKNSSFDLLCKDLKSVKDGTTVIFAGNSKFCRALSNDLNESGFNSVYMENPQDLPKGVVVTPGVFSCGFSYPELNFSLITYKKFSKPPQSIKPKGFKSIGSVCELSCGEPVVHASHGIGIFLGIHKIKIQNIVKDYICIQYANNDTLYVPVIQINMISKYIGPSGTCVKLNKLGTDAWKKAKKRAYKATREIAKKLFKIYKERIKTKGFAFSKDADWQKDFESKFEYEETQDQLRCVDEIKKDMQSKVPMDRLLCGDVGFGKTEVAFRAAFKCVLDSKQCAMLAPTTILAWQHFLTAKKRFESFPVKIELLSRIKTQKEQKVIIENLKNGIIDIIIGTHRLIQKDIVFKNLGLLIIDEEQRFGVSQKEKFKDVYKNVDILSLSATPIPRTLNMALAKIRDMSIIEQAPRNRQVVKTYVMEYDVNIISGAIKKELGRGGQVYFLHNNVETIEKTALKLKKLLPKARVCVGHGKLSEKDLLEAWRRVIEHEVDIFVCTTIIETGIDVPNVNTLIIENSDQMGLSQLYQIRGRVGRSSRRGYAYFVFKKNKILKPIAEKRLKAIREFVEFGSGLNIAMRDLELRGAGNILSADQHGHMADVGYDMYMRLLANAVKEEKNEEKEEEPCSVDLSVSTHIPEEYIERLEDRLTVYKMVSSIKTKQDAQNFIDKVKDRFGGEVPEQIYNLIDIVLIRNEATKFGIKKIKQKKQNIFLTFDGVNENLIHNLVNDKRIKISMKNPKEEELELKINEDLPINFLKQSLFKT
ncbi:MAG: transcription-repair coupling factor [Oscillospiraceae bacterium]|jgi:transcription-repair coupling factor (superfamily II helicase)|nr:transcription-repair coupling factor [Oscillospiraceae bacterium]